ncbi:MAG: F-type H+-transporting ATPase subunit a [Solirubrobacteraceae bacterium]|jgi:F-type H+-transporting ATPase subunit a|nr:F-type H+-transporting ATPase subunit a [Solirubrobacteraceae bacterium]
MSRRAKIFTVLGVYLFGLVLLVVLAGSAGKNDAYQPQNEFKLDPWINLPGPFDINKAVVYVIIAAVITVWAMIYIAHRMQDRPNRVQTLVETVFNLMRDNITRNNMDASMAAKWFPFIATLFLFIWVSNLIGYIPLPTNTEESFNLFGLNIPSFAIYSATANLSVPLVLALVVFIGFTVEGVRAKGPIGYLKGLIPKGVTGGMAAFIFVLELFSNLLRLISLSVRLFANILAGHLIILFMAGGIAVLLGIAAIGWLTLPLGVILFIFEVGLVATLQAFIFATLASIYFGGAVAHDH